MTVSLFLTKAIVECKTHQSCCDWCGLSLQSSAPEQVLDILLDILSWEIAEVVSPCTPHGLWSHIVIRVFLLIGTVCPRHPPYLVLPSCPLSRVFPYPQPGDTGGQHSAPAICQSLTSADPTDWCGKFDNTEVSIFGVWLENAYSCPQNWSLRDILHPKWGAVSMKS